MEALLKQQKSNVEKLNQITTNFGRDGASRKNKREYFERRIVRLAAWLKDFKETHAKLQEFDCSGQPYATDKTFEKAMEAHDKHFNTLQDGLAEFYGDDDKIGQESDDEENTITDNCIAQTNARQGI